VRDGLRRLHGAVRAGVAPVLAAPGRRQLRAGLGLTVALGAAVAVTVAVTATSTAAPRRPPEYGSKAAAASEPAGLQSYESLLSAIGTRPAGSAVVLAASERARLGETEAVAAQQAGLIMPTGGVLVPAATGTTPASRAGAASGSGQQLPPVGPAQEADLFVVAPQTIPPAAVQAIGRLPGVAAVNQLDAARIEVGGSEVATLGVDPVTFRQFAAAPTATSTALWQNVAAGDIAISYTMGEQESLPLGGLVTVTAAKTESLTVGGFGTVGITGVDAVVSASTAASLGMPAGNALVVSAPNTRLSVLVSSIQTLLPSGASVAPLVAQAAETESPAAAGWAGASGITAGSSTLTVAQTRAFLEAALSRLGDAYVWGGSGPTVFDCSGLVQWSMRQAGVVMPRVAAQQALTGPLIPSAQIQPGDLLFYHTDPTAPDYISHVAIYLGNGLMVQAPEPGLDVEVVPADFGSGFAGAVRVNPQLAAAVAG
jgi:cell wall-associated NlpC family hydrolase